MVVAVVAAVVVVVVVVVVVAAAVSAFCITSNRWRSATVHLNFAQTNLSS